MLVAKVFHRPQPLTAFFLLSSLVGVFRKARTRKKNFTNKIAEATTQPTMEAQGERVSIIDPKIFTVFQNAKRLCHHADGLAKKPRVTILYVRAAGM